MSLALEMLEAIAGVTKPGKKRPPGIRAKKKKRKPPPGVRPPRRGQPTKHEATGKHSVRHRGAPPGGGRGKAGVLQEPTTPDITGDMAAYPRRVQTYPRLQLTQLDSAPAPALKSMTFRGVIKGETANYRTYVQFTNVNFAAKMSKSTPDIIPGDEGAEAIWYKRPALKENSVRCFCECEDFKYRWAKELFDSKALMGGFKTFAESPFSYKRKTPPPPKGRPFANPEHHLGFCKHVNSMLLALRDSKRVGA